MTDNRPIAFLDSGVGGLPYLRCVMAKLPDESYLYVADNARFPYGDKPADELRTIVNERVERMIRAYDPKIIVIACNTASVVALGVLRATFSVPFVGVVPAVKPAALRSRTGRIGLLATNGTVSDTYTDGLIREFASTCVVTRIGDGALVNFIEYHFAASDRTQRFSALGGVIDLLKNSKIDTLVIGCTHFIYIEDYLADALEGEVEIVDSREGVGRQIAKIAGGAGFSDANRSFAILVTTSPSDPERFDRFAELFGLRFRGVLGG